MSAEHKKWDTQVELAFEVKTQSTTGKIKKNRKKAGSNEKKIRVIIITNAFIYVHLYVCRCVFDAGKKIYINICNNANFNLKVHTQCKYISRQNNIKKNLTINIRK